MSDRTRARRRWFGMFFLVIAAGLLVWGQTVFEPRLRGLAFVVYWLICFVFTALALLTAWVDLRALRRTTREEQRELVERTLKQLEDDAAGVSDEKSKKR